MQLKLLKKLVKLSVRQLTHVIESLKPHSLYIKILKAAFRIEKLRRKPSQIDISRGLNRQLFCLIGEFFRLNQIIIRILVQ